MGLWHEIEELVVAAVELAAHPHSHLHNRLHGRRSTAARRVAAQNTAARQGTARSAAGQNSLGMLGFAPTAGQVHGWETTGCCCTVRACVNGASDRCNGQVGCLNLLRTFKRNGHDA